MLKLKKTISQLDQEIFKSIEETLIKNKADNFLFLFQSYKKELKDGDITKALNLNSNSFYVLKSRLYDKIQDHLSGDIYLNREELLKKLHRIPEMCLGEPREITTAFLQKLEKDLLEFDMHNELLLVYSALKKTHLYSEKYFHYSQLYNKHIAFSLSLEKSEEILGSFNRILGQYNFSRLPKLIDSLLFLRRDISDHYALNKSRQIEIIKNVIELQLCIFCNTRLSKENNIEELLNHTQKIINELPESSSHKTWMAALDFLYFEYYFKIKQTKLAQSYYEKVNSKLGTLLLYTNICNTSRFLVSKIAFLQENGRTSELLKEGALILIYDGEDVHTKVLLGIYHSMICYYSGKYKETSVKLNELLNENSFKDYFHINTDIKLTLAFIYIILKDYDLAESITKSIYRKIKTEKIENYSNVLDLIKVFDADIKQNNGKITQRQKDDITLFAARNINESEVLQHLQAELKNKYC
jgi:hypothetical protein